MSTTTRYTARILSSILTIALLFTSGVTPVFAAEINNQLLTTRPAELAVNSAEVPEEGMPHEALLSLLERIDEYETFTQAERLLLYQYLNIGYDEEKAAAEEAKADTAFYAEFQKLPSSTRSELKILQMDHENKVYADLNEDEKSVIYDYLGIAEDKQSNVDSVFTQLSVGGESLFESMLTVQLLADGLFTLAEAQTLTTRYPERAARDKEVDSFRAFTENFSKPASVTGASMVETKQQFAVSAETAKLRAAKAAYLNESAFTNAKSLFLNGTSATDIIAAFSVAATMNLSPNDLLIDRSTVGNVTTTVPGELSLASGSLTATAEENSFLSLFPVKLAPVRAQLNAAAMQMSGQKITTASDLTLETIEMQSALYSTNSVSGSTNANDDSNVVLPPFLADLSKDTGVSLNTGSAYHEVGLVHIPGVNGMDIDLGIQYTSSESNTKAMTENASGIISYNAFVEHKSYLLYGSTQVLYTEDVYTLPVATSEDASPFIYSYIANDGQVEAIGASIADTKVVDQIWQNRIVLTGTYTPYEITSNTSNPAPSSLSYNDGSYSGTLTPYASVTLYNSGIVQTGANSWQQTIDIIDYFSGNVTAYSSALLHTYPWHGVMAYPVYATGTTASTTSEQRHHIGSGWSWNIPYIEINAYNTDEGFLYLPGKGTLKFQNVCVDGENYGFYNYSAKDLSLKQNAMLSHPQGIASKYYLAVKDGSGYYFSADGRLLAHHSVQGNQLFYQYASTNATGKLSAITDTFGRAVTITRTTTTTGEKVTITTPDNYSTVLTLTRLSWMDSGDLALTAITYPDQTQEIFSYAQGAACFSNSSKTPTTGAVVPYALLTSITYPTGAILSYAYGDTATINHNFIGSRTIFRVTERKWTAGGIEYNKQTYVYNGEYTNYPNTCYTLPQYYYYSVEVHENNGTYAVYRFNRNQQLESVYEYGLDNNFKFAQGYDYDHNGFMIYQSYIRREGDSVASTIERYKYDDYGNLVSKLSPKANGDESKKQYQTSYLYGNYGLVLHAQYMQNSNQNVIVNNTYDGCNLTQTITSMSEQNWEQKITYGYDTYGRVINQKEYLSSNAYIETGYGYTGANLTSKTTYNVLDADGALIGNVTELYGYDSMGRMTSVTDGDGNTTRTTYDSRGRVTSVTSPEGRTVTYAHNPTLNTVTETTSGMTPVKYTYNALGLLVSETLPSLGITRKTNTYDNRGRLTSESNAAGTSSSGTTYYTYDVFDRLVQKRVTDRANVELYRETLTYNDSNIFGYQIIETLVESNAVDAPAIRTYVGYNVNGEKVGEGVVRANGTVNETDYYYDYVGNVVATLSPLAPSGTQVTENIYQSPLGQPYLTTVRSVEATANVRSVNAVYDRLGRNTVILSGNNTYISKDYDALNRQLREATNDIRDMSLQSAVEYTYDGAGRVVKEKTANSATGSAPTSWKTVEYAYDKDGNLTDTITHVTSTNKQYTHYVYDAAGNLTHEYSGMSSPWTPTMSASAYKLTTYTYDNRGRLTSLTDGLGQNETYTYDNNDNLVTKTLRDGKQERYSYNALGLIVTDAVYASAAATTPLTTRSYTYYPTGALKTVTENGITLTYTYDERGNMLTESDGTSVKSYTYNEFDGRASYTLKVNNVAIASETYAYDAARQLASVTTDNVQVTYGYDMNGNRTNDVTFNKTTGVALYGHNYAFDGANRVVNVQGMVSVNNGASLLIPVSETYTYNLDGSRSSKLDNNTSVTTSYGYDGAGRLTYEIEGSAVTTYAYDASNNRTSMLSGGVTTTYTYDANNRLLSEVKGSQVTNYTYDANGNQLSGNGLVTYDARGRQSTWTDGLTTASYTYYPTDLRKSKTVGATTTNFVWDGQNMVYEYKGTNTLGGTAYYYGLTLISQGNYAYYLYNGHGDVVQLVTSTGALGRSYDYDAFGNEVNPSASDTNPFRYAGQYFDSETGTYYLRARYYDPGIGRFTQQDGWIFGHLNYPHSLNLYIYCWNEPVGFVDPSGHQREAGYYTINGIYAWYEDPDATEFGLNSDTYRIIDDLSVRWWATEDANVRNQLHDLANEARNMHRAGTPYKYSTDDINEFLRLNASHMRSLAELYKYMPTKKLRKFVELVRTGGMYDLKSQEEWQNPYANETNNITKTMTPYMYYDGMIWSAEMLGNYSFGYLGAAYGYGGEFISFGAGVYQVFSGTASWKWYKTYFDDPRDYYYINLGFEAYNMID